MRFRRGQRSNLSPDRRRLESSEQSKKYEEELSEDMAIELRRRLSKLPMKERIASDRRVIESIFEVVYIALSVAKIMGGVAFAGAGGHSKLGREHA